MKRASTAWHRVGTDRPNGAARRARRSPDRQLPGKIRHHAVIPSTVGRDGVSAALEPDLSDEERAGLAKSAESLKKALERVSG
jgi:hypothetical protein